MNWSDTTKIATTAACAIGGYYIYKKITKIDEFHEIHDEIDEESVDSDQEIEENKIIKPYFTGHGDQFSYRSRCSEIEQLLHLLRVSLRVELNEKILNSILVSLNELHKRARLIVSIEDMLDSGIISLLASALEKENEKISLSVCQVLNNLSTCNKGLKESKVLIEIIIKQISNFIKLPQCINTTKALFSALSNIICNPEYDTVHNNSFLKLFIQIYDLFETNLVQPLLDNYVLKLAVNFSAQPSGNSMLIESDLISKIEKVFLEKGEECPEGSLTDSVLRCLYIFQNLIKFKSPDSLYWMPSKQTMIKVNSLASSLETSPAIVERAISIKRLTKL
jgi:hypothetical protein